MPQSPLTTHNHPFSHKPGAFPSTSPPPAQIQDSFEFLGIFRKQPGEILWHFELKGCDNPDTFWGCPSLLHPSLFPPFFPTFYPLKKANPVDGLDDTGGAARTFFEGLG